MALGDVLREVWSLMAGVSEQEGVLAVGALDKCGLNSRCEWSVGCDFLVLMDDFERLAFGEFFAGCSE